MRGDEDLVFMEDVASNGTFLCGRVCVHTYVSSPGYLPELSLCVTHRDELRVHGDEW